MKIRHYADELTLCQKSDIKRPTPHKMGIDKLRIEHFVVYIVNLKCHDFVSKERMSDSSKNTFILMYSSICAVLEDLFPTPFTPIL